MAIKSLAIKYRPKTFDDVVEQENIKIILKQQLATNTTKNAYLFCGGAGTGKTTCARIFANEINNHQGNPIEMDAASNSGVDDVREIINQAKTKSLDSEYKVFIIDECHSISNTGWQAFLKLIEEPPAKSIFIFCTTDPQKIPKTILSRVQRYDFQRISFDGIVHRLAHILADEFPSATGINDVGITVDKSAIEYIAKIADGGMRDAITLMDKCLAYSTDLTLENVVKALGVLDYEEMFDLLDFIQQNEANYIVEFIEKVHRSGRDLKQFVRQFTNFVLDVGKYCICKSFDYIQIPNLYKDELDGYIEVVDEINHLLSVLVKLNAEIKWDESPKAMIEATFILECTEC